MSAVTDVLATAIVPIARLVADIAEGKIKEPGDVAKALVGIALDAAPDADLHGFLDDAARERQEALFELAKKEKFGG